MAYGQCLYRRRSGIYAIRIVIPDHLRARVGQREFHCSTGLSRREAALEHAIAVRSRWLRLFLEMDTLDAAKLALAEPWLMGEGWMRLDDAARLFDLDPHVLAMQVVNRGFALWANAVDWDARVLDDLDNVDREGGEYLWQSVDGEGTVHCLSGLVSMHDSMSIAQELQRGGTPYVYRLNSTCLAVGLLGAVFIRPRSVALASCDLSVRQRDLEVIRVAFAKAFSAPAESRSPSSLASPGTASHLGQRTTNHGQDPVQPRVSQAVGHNGATATTGRTVTELIAGYVADQGTAHPPELRARWKPAETERNKQKLRCFPEFMGDVPLSELDSPMSGEDLVKKYLALLVALPTGPELSRARRETNDAPASQLVTWAVQNNARRLEARTAYDYLGKLSECIAWGIKRGLMRRNAVQNVIPRTAARHPAIRENEIREHFTDEELLRIFSAPWFQSGRSRITAKGKADKHYRPFYYWLPLLALHTGGRANELSQLYLTDIQESSEGIPFIRFQISHQDQMESDEPDSGLIVNDKSLKTVNSNRDIPIHSKLISLGFMKYVEALRAAGTPRLFPELRYDSEKGYGLEARKWFNERFLGKKLEMPRTGKKVLHSMRHNYATAIPSDPRLERTKNQLMGHERGVTLAGTRYTGEAPVSETSPVIEALQFNLPQIAPFDIEDGLRALGVAARLKVSHSHRKRQQAVPEPS